MTSRPAVSRRAETLLGMPVVATAPVAGGDICTATKLRLSNGTTALMKTLSSAPAGFFEREAAGLRWLGEAAGPDGRAGLGGRGGGVPTPDVLAVDDECLILAWVEPGRGPTSDDAAAFGRALAATHAAGAPAFGAEVDGFIGRLPLPMRAAPTWAEFFATRRVLPYLKLARDRGRISKHQGDTVEAVVPRLPALLPDEPPSRLHGDLWNGNVVWGVEGATHVIDPAAYGGHREADLAMLSLFGLPHLPRVLEAYDEAHPLADDWEDRLALHQLFPLLVHACLFGGGYGPRAAAVAQRYR